MKDLGAQKVSREAVTAWFAGRNGIRPDNVPYLAEALGVSLPELVAELHRLREPAAASTAVPLSPNKSVTGSVTAPDNLDVSVSAGAPSGPQPVNLYDAERRWWEKQLYLSVAYLGRANAGEGGGHIAQGEEVGLPATWLMGLPAQQVGAVEVVGHCLHPVASDGDWLLIDRHMRPHHGTLVVVLVRDTEEEIAKFWDVRADGSVWLVPHPMYRMGEPVRFDEKQHIFLGVCFFIWQPKGVPGMVLHNPRLQLIRADGTFGPPAETPPPERRQQANDIASVG